MLEDKIIVIIIKASKHKWNIIRFVESIMETVISYNEISFQNYLNSSNNYSLNFKKSIASIIDNNGFLEYTIDINDIDANNGNYLARLYEVDITGRTEECKKEIHLFIKECLVMQKMKIIDINELYDKEVFMYTNYANVANKLQSEVKIPEYDRFNFVPAYGGNSEIIILDNLSKKGFKTYYRMDVMSIKYAELAIKELAKFHALGFAVERKMPEYFETQIKTKKSSYHFDDDWSEYITKVCSNTAKTIDRAPASLENYAPIMKDKLNKYLTKPGNLKKCVSHGDYRMNNILVKEKDGEPTEVSVVDYQFIDYGNPIRDFFFFIYMSSDRKFRKNYLAALKNTYYDTLTRFLAYFNLDIDNVYPGEEFEKTYTECQDFGPMMALYAAPFLFASENETVDASKLSMSELALAVMDIRYKDRVQGFVDDLVELGQL